MFHRPGYFRACIASPSFSLSNNPNLCWLYASNLGKSLVTLIALPLLEEDEVTLLLLLQVANEKQQDFTRAVLTWSS